VNIQKAKFQSGKTFYQVFSKFGRQSAVVHVYGYEATEKLDTVAFLPNDSGVFLQDLVPYTILGLKNM
jgi:hypothetical protein